MKSKSRFSTHTSVCILLLISQAGYAQSTSGIITYKDSTSSYLSISAYGSSSGRTPFWIQSNQFGMIPKASPAGSVGGALEKYWKLNRRGQWRFGAGAEAVGILGEESRILLPQAHATLRFRNWELFAGRKKQWVGLSDSTLSSGSYSWSTNALPIPKVHLGTTKFVAVPFTNGWISFQASYSDGWFESGRPVTGNLKLHQKTLYGRIGRPNSKLKLYGGFNHQAQWGGSSDYNTVDGKMPNDLENYFNVVTGRKNTNNPSHHDNTNRVGNHLGSIDLGFEIETANLSILGYRQNLYEDGSLYWLNNIADGLNGIRLKRKNAYDAGFEINTMLIEYLYTKSQGGPDADDNLPKWKRGKDDYFNNGQVRDGWSYFDRTIGTPFITPTSETIWNWPNYANFFTSNNRVSVMHLGLAGTFARSFLWAGKFSYSSNAGAYDVPFEGTPRQFSAMVSVETRLRFMGNLHSKLMLATDLGGLYPKNYGAGLSITRFFQPAHTGRYRD